MFLLVRRCAEHMMMTQLPRLKAKVTGQDQRIYPLILNPLIDFHDTLLI